jgi:hypothetical protein
VVVFMDLLNRDLAGNKLLSPYVLNTGRRPGKSGALTPLELFRVYRRLRVSAVQE